jgi:hypothetical protein
MTKYIFSIISMLTLIISLVGCNEEINLSTDFQETAVIYGLLDQSEQIHYIKINRAFIGPGSSIDIAKIPDSSYFKNVEAKITELGGTNRVWTLRDTIVGNKDQNGLFYAPDQKLYYFDTKTNPLNAAYSYKLTVTIDKGLSSEFIITGQTSLVNNIALQSSATFKLGLIDNNNLYKSTALNLNSGTATTVNAKFNMIVNEYIGTNFDSISIPWNINELDAGTTTDMTMNLNGQTFYEVIKNGITNNPAITKRNLKAIKIVLTGGSSDLHNYILVNKPSSSISQSKPTYTNLISNSAKNKVVGLFSARQTVTYYFPFQKVIEPNYRLLDLKSTKELCNGSYTTYDYKFCSQHTNDMGELFYCQ